MTENALREIRRGDHANQGEGRKPTPDFFRDDEWRYMDMNAFAVANFLASATAQSL